MYIQLQVQIIYEQNCLCKQQINTYLFRHASTNLGMIIFKVSVFLRSESGLEFKKFPTKKKPAFNWQTRQVSQSEAWFLAINSLNSLIGQLELAGVLLGLSELFSSIRPQQAHWPYSGAFSKKDHQRPQPVPRAHPGMIRSSIELYTSLKTLYIPPESIEIKGFLYRYYLSIY